MSLEITCVTVSTAATCIEFTSISRMLLSLYILPNGIGKYFNKTVILLYEVLVIYFIMVVIILLVSRKRKKNLFLKLLNTKQFSLWSLINISILFHSVNPFHGCTIQRLLVGPRPMGLCFGLLKWKTKLKWVCHII